MKIVFLDHQGVMRRDANPVPGTLVDFDRDAVHALNSVLETHGDVEIVVSSDWRVWCDLEEMQDFYAAQGVQRVPVDMTPYLPSSWQTPWKSPAEQRAREILQWLATHKHVDKWVAVDDLPITVFLGTTCTVEIDPAAGLASHVDALSVALL